MKGLLDFCGILNNFLYIDDDGDGHARYLVTASLSITSQTWRKALVEFIVKVLRK